MNNSNEVTTSNIFDLFKKNKDTQSTIILENSIIKIEKVLAQGQISKEGFFCPQIGNDLLVQLRGKLELEYEEDNSFVVLNPGDSILTSPNQKNRISGTSDESIWLKFSFYGNVMKESFPSPDFRMIKEKIKYELLKNTAFIDSIVETKNIRIERVVSNGQISDKNSWCEVNYNEFLVLLKGNTVLEINNTSYKMSEGDYIIIPPMAKNRVAYTSTSQETIWLAVYFEENRNLIAEKYPFSTGYTY